MDVSGIGGVGGRFAPPPPAAESVGPVPVAIADAIPTAPSGEPVADADAALAAGGGTGSAPVGLLGAGLGGAGAEYEAEAAEAALNPDAGGREPPPPADPADGSTIASIFQSTPVTSRRASRSTSSRADPAKVSRNPELLKPSCRMRPSTPTTCTFWLIITQATLLRWTTASRTWGHCCRIDSRPAPGRGAAAEPATAALPGRSPATECTACAGALCGCASREGGAAADEPPDLSQGGVASESSDGGGAACVLGGADA
jgi:hypothetical protein